MPTAQSYTNEYYLPSPSFYPKLEIDLQEIARLPALLSHSLSLSPLFQETKLE